MMTRRRLAVGAARGGGSDGVVDAVAGAGGLYFLEAGGDG